MPFLLATGHYSTVILLLVMFNDSWIAHCGLVGVETKLSAGTALTQQVPTLIQSHLDVLHTSMLSIVQLPLFCLFHKLVFLAHQLFDGVQKFAIVHGFLLNFLSHYLHIL